MFLVARTPGIQLAAIDNIFAQKLYDLPVDLSVPMAPVPVKADGSIPLIYEPHITNFRAKP
jgi:hypothetical protein